MSPRSPVQQSRRALNLLSFAHSVDLRTLPKWLCWSQYNPENLTASKWKSISGGLCCLSSSVRPCWPFSSPDFASSSWPLKAKTALPTKGPNAQVAMKIANSSFTTSFTECCGRGRGQNPWSRSIPEKTFSTGCSSRSKPQQNFTKTALKSY